MLPNLFLRKGFLEREWGSDTRHRCLISGTLGSPSEGSHITMLLRLSICYHIVLRLTDAFKHS